MENNENNKKRILLIEDEEMIRSMYSVKMKQEGFDVVLAENGMEGLEKLEAEDFDLVFLDVIMPQMDGFSVLEKIKQNEEKNKIPVIMLSNLSTDEDRKKAENMGAKGYLVKASMTPGQISKEIQKYFNKE